MPFGRFCGKARYILGFLACRLCILVQSQPLQQVEVPRVSSDPVKELIILNAQETTLFLGVCSFEPLEALVNVAQEET